MFGQGQAYCTRLVRWGKANRLLNKRQLTSETFMGSRWGLRYHCALPWPPGQRARPSVDDHTDLGFMHTHQLTSSLLRRRQRDCSAEHQLWWNVQHTTANWKRRMPDEQAGATVVEYRRWAFGCISLKAVTCPSVRIMAAVLPLRNLLCLLD
jgi:hypothetical protein